ncbi:response regulator containing a CheY-like receiver domain and a GGDEF domain [Methylophilaceae bacterium 11]|jgi:CheY-like chemotaxis protein/DNA-binding CsgD family transcriptional regulator|uniref:response regulator transcription factor n=1 Tax=unclassified Methylotenera TaxID=2643294 RepID=UPI000375FA43|nr:MULTISPECIES: response regulator transcription factor [unclassified Methylotenera]EUJ11173.1 response regulator containing a CheY-like receiver domain and a GGDEF domain [Methylophilaceae bacterium 11]
MNTLTQTPTVLIVDDVLDNLAYLHDALDESGYMVLVADSGQTALQRANDAQPNVILLDAMMPGIDGFETCRQLKANSLTRHIPVIFMTGLTEAEHVAAGFEAGGVDYVTKPIRPKEVLARIASHLQTVKLMNQARSALDAFGQAAIAITPQDGKIVWQSPLARQWMQRYFYESGLHAADTTPEPMLNWLQNMQQANAERTQALNMIKGSSRLTLSLADDSSDEQWIILLSEESDEAQIQALTSTFGLTKRESEVLYWAIKGKTNRDIGDILGTSPRTVNKHLEHVFSKLGVETRTAAASYVASKLRTMK